jgi:hypothetical protein
MITQLNPPIPVVTLDGKGMAHMVIDYGIEHDLLFVVFQDDTGECWCWQNKYIRIQTNITIGRNNKENRSEV